MPRTTKSGRAVPALRTLCTALFALSSVSVLWLVIAGSYDVRLGPVHLAAHGLFKPLLEFNGLLLLLWAVAPTAAASLQPNERTPSARTTFFVIVGIVVVLYGAVDGDQCCLSGLDSSRYQCIHPFDAGFGPPFL